MTFSSIDEIKRHPQACFISRDVWIKILGGWASIPEYWVGWMNIPYEELKVLLTPKPMVILMF